MSERVVVLSHPRDVDLDRALGHPPFRLADVARTGVDVPEWHRVCAVARRVMSTPPFGNVRAGVERRHQRVGIYYGALLMGAKWIYDGDECTFAQDERAGTWGMEN